MPLNVPDKLPAITTLQKENIFVMTESRATHQDIRPLRILLLNLMPLKISTETHILRALSNTPLQVEIELIQTATYTSTHTSEDHLSTFYKTFDQIKEQKFDGMIITGAPVEHLDFEEVKYWEEMTSIMDWSRKHVTSTLYICWAAQAGLFHHFNVPKHPLNDKMFGVFNHKVLNPTSPIVRGFDDEFLAPHSRHTTIYKEDLNNIDGLELISESPEAGVYIVAETSGKGVYVTGHSEYDPETLKEEYERDRSKGENIAIPRNYFPNNNPEQPPVVRWRGHANLLYSNWLNYYVYQETPYRLEDIS